MGKNSTIGLKASNGPYVLVKDHIYVLVEGPILLTLVEELLLAIIVGVHGAIMFEVMEMCLVINIITIP
jgi:hypothetical protein